jgi:hypothetical protein
VRPRPSSPRGARRAGLALGLCLLACPGLPALEFKVEKLAFLPARFYVGEEVEALALVSFDGAAPEPEAFSVKAGDGLSLPSASAQADPEIRSIALSKTGSGWELRIGFVAWSPVASSLPRMSQHGLDIPPIAYAATPSLEPGGNEPAPPKPQLEAPGTAFYLYGFLGLLVLVGAAIFGFAAWVLPAASALAAKRRAGEARRNFQKTLAWLGKVIPESEPPAFYAALSRAIRNYLAARVLSEAPSLTPSELAGLSPELFLGPEIKQEAVSLLAESDSVRFGGESSGETLMRGALARAEKLGDAAEEALDARL